MTVDEEEEEEERCSTFYIKFLLQNSLIILIIRRKRYVGQKFGVYNDRKIIFSFLYIQPSCRPVVLENIIKL